MDYKLTGIPADSNGRMKCRSLLTLLLFLEWQIFSLSAETVMVTVHRNMTQWEILSAVEGGAMEVLFDAGYIVFNSLGGNSSGIFPSIEDFKAAREGGASLLLALEVEASPPSPSEPLLPLSVRYELFLVADRQVLVRGIIEKGEIPRSEGEQWEQYADRWGREAAERTVKGLR